ncbi:MAG TPA: hypothetical protein VM677_14240 [Actinokineospora sp.]|nr:hypothetical protein [Actinokineospora sp.]
MDPEDLTRALRGATDTLEPRPSFTTDVIRGGKRRQVRHRVAIAGGLAALVGITGGTAVLLSPSPNSLPGQENQKDLYDFSILNGPTRGDLAGDQAYLAQVIQAWQKGIEVSPSKPTGTNQLTGSPKVIWAGTTPVGKAAIVGQAGETKDRYFSGDGSPLPTMGPAFGLVTGDQPTLVNEVPLFSATPPTFLFGPQDVMLVSLNPKAEFVSSWTVGHDGKGNREWNNLNPTDGDPRLIQLPNGTDPRTVRVTDLKGLQAGTSWMVRPSSTYGEGADRQSKPIPSRTLDWPQQPLRVNGAVGAELTESHDAMVAKGMADAQEMAQVTGFQAIIDLPDGRSLVGFEYVPDFTGSRFYAAITDRSGKVESITYGGRLNKDTVSAKVRLDEGWLVAAYGATLRYRTAPNAPWTAAGRDAALLPTTATQLEVTVDGQTPKVVTL